MMMDDDNTKNRNDTLNEDSNFLDNKDVNVPIEDSPVDSFESENINADGDRTESESTEDGNAPSAVDKPKAHKTLLKQSNRHEERIREIKRRLDKTRRKAEDVYYTIRQATNDAYRNSKNAVSRAVKGYDSPAIFDCGPYLMVDIPKRLRRFAETTIGYPADYDDPSKWLSVVPRNDDWPERFAPDGLAARALSFDGDVMVGDVVPEGDGALVSRLEDDGRVIHTFARNKDVGLGFAAWIEDIKYAADIIEEWGNASGDILWMDKYDNLYGHDKALEMQEELHRKFTVVWAWLGENLPALWD